MQVCVHCGQPEVLAYGMCMLHVKVHLGSQCQAPGTPCAQCGEHPVMGLSDVCFACTRQRMRDQLPLAVHAALDALADEGDLEAVNN